MRIHFSFILVLILSLTAHAVIMGHNEFTVDFTEPNSIREHGIVWLPDKKVQQTEQGLVFSSPKNNTSIDFELITKPYAIGLSWRPTSSANLNVEVSPVGEETTYSGSTLHPSHYAVYVRYSPDLKNWSSWQALYDKPTDAKSPPKADSHQYTVWIRVPEKERKAYNEYNHQYMRMDVPWGSDEEAMVKWMLTQDPDFFEKHIPFIGYVQFLCEGSMRANQPLFEMKISIGWGVGGIHSIPKDESVYKNREDIPWRYKVPDSAQLPEDS